MHHFASHFINKNAKARVTPLENDDTGTWTVALFQNPCIDHKKTNYIPEEALSFLPGLTDGYGVMESSLYLKMRCVLVLVLPHKPVPWASHLTFLGLSSPIHEMEPSCPL